MQLTSTSPWTESPEALAKSMETHLHHGLSTEAVAAREVVFGRNIFEREKRTSGAIIFIRQFTNPLVIVLLVAVFCTLALAEWLDALIIGFAILVNAVLGFVQEYKAERAIADLRSYILERTRVVRNGEEQEVDSRELVPGDIIHLTTGARVTADARVTHSVALSVDESVLTGESLPVTKHTEVLPLTTALAERENMVFAGTVVVGGTGYAIVTRTGRETEIGVLATLVRDTHAEKTPLQIAMSKIAWVIVAAVTVIVGLIFGAGIMQGRPIYDMVLISIAIIVGAVPEALPIGLTAVLAIGVERIAKKKGIMRSLTAAETLGSTTVIMTDKTGTLTEARMELVHVAQAETLADASFHAEDVHKHYSAEQKDVLRLAVYNADVVVEDDTVPPEDWTLMGSALETNLVRAAGHHGIIATPAERHDVHMRVPFSSVHKFSVSSVPAALLPEAYRHIKNPHIVVGAPDILLERSKMRTDVRTKTQHAVELLSESGRRVLAVALVSMPLRATTITPEMVKQCTFVGTLSFVDPIRAEVPEALRRIESHGVRVVMITGDLPGTARAVGKSLGWEITDTSVMTGEQMAQLSDDELTVMLQQVRIFARVTPSDKVRVTRLFQRLGEVVAMTGDGVNDGPALKSANIGIAVGSGSDVAKSIADLVLLDNNFETIVATIEEGKQMLVNIKKIFVYLMSNALDEVILIGGSILMGIAMPLTAMQIIWANLFTGSIPAIAYAFDRKQGHTPTTGKTFFDPTVRFLVIVVGIVSSLLLFLLYIALLAFAVPLEIAQSVIFVCFSAYILVIAYSFKNLSAPIYTYSLTDNKVLVWGTLLGAVLIWCTIYMSFFQTLFTVAPFPLVWYILIIVWLLLNIFIVEVAKFVARKYFA